MFFSVFQSVEVCFTHTFGTVGYGVLIDSGSGVELASAAEEMARLKWIKLQHLFAFRFFFWCSWQPMRTSAKNVKKKEVSGLSAAAEFWALCISRSLPAARKGGKTEGGAELHVLIKGAKNLTAMKAGGTSDSFVKRLEVQLLMLLYNTFNVYQSIISIIRYYYYFFSNN